MADDGFSTRVAGYRNRVDQVMADFVAARRPGQQKLAQAISYAVNARGKRIRPLLAYATAELLGITPAIADYPAAAVELIHTCSLVHDDLPAMDNDDLRRGRPAVHKQFDEATAILVGDALFLLPFALLTEADVAPDVILAWVRHLAIAAGVQGFIQGQAMDLEGEGSTLALDELEATHRAKSGALISASMILTAMAQGGFSGHRLKGQPEQESNHQTLQRLTLFGHHLGLAFQIQDDILDVQGTTAQLGKPQGSDVRNDKSTFVSLLGVDGARERMYESLASAEAALDEWGDRANGLRWLARYITERSR